MTDQTLTARDVVALYLFGSNIIGDRHSFRLQEDMKWGVRFAQLRKLKEQTRTGNSGSVARLNVARGCRSVRLG
jgi:hypothetical protein